MTQNDEKLPTLEGQVDALYHGHNRYSTITQNRFRYELMRAEKRGAEEQRRKEESKIAAMEGALKRIAESESFCGSQTLRRTAARALTQAEV